MDSTDRDRALFRGVFLVSLATLLFEIALIRVLSFTIWYHFAYAVISTALLGFGAAGTLLAVRPGIGSRDLQSTLARCSILDYGLGSGFFGDELGNKPLDRPIRLCFFLQLTAGVLRLLPLE